MEPDPGVCLLSIAGKPGVLLCRLRATSLYVLCSISVFWVCICPGNIKALVGFEVWQDGVQHVMGEEASEFSLTITAIQKIFCPLLWEFGGLLDLLASVCRRYW